MSDEPQAERPAPAQILARLATAAVLVVADLWSKAGVFAWLSDEATQLEVDLHGHERRLILGEWFAFMMSWNPGMAWGIDAIPAPVLVSGRGLAVLFLIWILVRAERGRPVFTTAIVLILAGAAGNLYDNLAPGTRRDGATFGEVRDFIDVYLPFMDGTLAFPNGHFPTFNVADACISVGAVLLFAASLAPGARSAPSRTAD